MLAADRRFGGEVLIGGPTARLVAHWCGASRLVTRARGFTFRGTVRAAPARRSSPTSHPLAANPSRWPLFTGPVTVSLVDREVPDSASGTSQGFHSASMTRAFASPTGRKTALESEADAGTRTPDPFITSEVLYQLSYVGVCSASQTRFRSLGWRQLCSPGPILAFSRIENRAGELTGLVSSRAFWRSESSDMASTLASDIAGGAPRCDTRHSD